MAKAVDVSNHQSGLTAAMLATWKAEHDVQLLIVQAVAPSPPWPPTQTRRQIEAAAEAGMATDAYLWAWTHSDVEADMRRKLALLDGLPVGRLWLDAEDTESASFAARRSAITRAFAVLDEWSAERGLPRPGIYTAWWYVGGYLGYARTSPTPWSDRDLWNAEYDGLADADVFHPFCGWASTAVKQYTASGRLPGYGGDLDLNALSASEAARVAGGVAEPEPQSAVDQAWLDKKDAVVNVLGWVHGDAVARLRAHRKRADVEAVADDLERETGRLL
jgi:hypothetical protein